jgi:drug/metabolite transporter (DMT)-like permease
MPPELLAILGTLAYAATNICVRLGVRTTSVLAGLFISLVVGVVITLAVLVFALPSSLTVPGLVFFAISGLLGHGLGRWASMVGIERLGPAAATPLMSSLYPIFAVAAAALTLSERLGVQRVIGVAVVVLGVYLISSQDRAATTPDGPAAGYSPSSMLLYLPAFGFPLAAGVLYGASDVFRKRATEVLPNAPLGALIATSCALIVWTAAWAASDRVRSQVRFGFRHTGWWWFALSGVFSAVAVLVVTKAMELGDVSVVTPIVAAQPLPVLLLSALFLRTNDPFDLRVVVGTLCILAGTIAISTD